MNDSKPKPRPNVLTILVDQCRYDMFSYMRHPFLVTPNLDRLRNEGALFSQAVCASPLCGPSRAAMIAGRFSLTGTWYEYANRELEDAGLWTRPLRTVDELLAASGYHVEYHGKWHTGQGHWDCYRTRDDLFAHRISRYREYLAAKQAVPSGPGLQVENYTGWPYRPASSQRLYETGSTHGYHLFPRTQIGVFDCPDEDSLTAWTVNKTIRFLQSPPRSPWAVTCSILAPHLPFTPTPGYANLYDPREISVPPNFNAYPNPLQDPIKRKPPFPDAMPLDGDGLGQFLALYYALHKEVDDHIGRLLGALERTGRMDDTLIVFASDHGEMGGSHNSMMKFVFFEESLRVPLLLRYPREIPPGIECACPASGVDLAPTVLDFCGIDHQEPFHGKSLRPRIGKPCDPNAFAFAENRHGWCLRSATWKATFHRDGEPAMLFHLAEDPGEFVNLLDSPLSAEGREALEHAQDELGLWLRKGKSGDA